MENKKTYKIIGDLVSVRQMEQRHLLFTVHLWSYKSRIEPMFGQKNINFFLSLPALTIDCLCKTALINFKGDKNYSRIK